MRIGNLVGLLMGPGVLALHPIVLDAQQPAPVVSTTAGLDQLVSRMDVTAARDDRVPPSPLRPGPSRGILGVVRGGYDGAPRWIFQQDSAMRTPFAAVGKSVLVVNTATRDTMTVRVTARRRLVGRGDEACGGPELDSSLQGWGYAIHRLPPTDPAQLIVLPGAARVGGDSTGVPPTVRRAMRDSLRLAATARVAALRRESGPGWASEVHASLFDARGRLTEHSTVTVLPVRAGTAGGFAASFRLNDDPSDHGMESTWTLIVDANGRRIQRLEGVRASLVVDSDGDGVDELVTDNALSYFDGRRWTLVRGWTGPGSC